MLAQHVLRILCMSIHTHHALQDTAQLYITHNTHDIIGRNDTHDDTAQSINKKELTPKYNDFTARATRIKINISLS